MVVTRMKFGRVVTALVTPFDEHGIDEVQLGNVLEHLIETGTDSVVVAGTTGESPTLSHEEKLWLFEKVVSLVKGRIPVIAGVGSNDTRSSIRLAKEAEACGVDALLLVAPYYNKPSQEGLYQHFKAIANETALPIMLYNIPGRTSINISAETTLRLAQIENIVAIKESSGDFTQISHIIRQKPEDFLLYSGDDVLLLPILAIGGYGVVSVAAHVVGRDLQQMIQSFLAGKVEFAARLHSTLLPLFEGLFATSNPVMLKRALQEIGIPVGNVRLPLVGPNEEQEQLIVQIMSSLRKATV